MCLCDVFFAFSPCQNAFDHVLQQMCKSWRDSFLVLTSHTWWDLEIVWRKGGAGLESFLLVPEPRVLRSSSSWTLWDKLRLCSTPLVCHNNRPVWMFECAILCAVCFTWARQWLHLASLLCWGLLRHHGSPAVPHPAPSLARLCTCPRCWDSWAQTAIVGPTQDPSSHFVDCCFGAKLETSQLLWHVRFLRMIKQMLIIATTLSWWRCTVVQSRVRLPPLKQGLPLLKTNTLLMKSKKNQCRRKGAATSAHDEVF